MTVVLESLRSVLVGNGLVAAFAFVGITVWFSYLLSDRLTRGRVHGSAIAILIGLALAYAGGLATGGERGLADVEILAGVGLLGGAMIRDLAIVATASLKSVHLKCLENAQIDIPVSALAAWAAVPRATPIAAPAIICRRVNDCIVVLLCRS